MFVVVCKQKYSEHICVTSIPVNRSASYARPLRTSCHCCIAGPILVKLRPHRRDLFFREASFAQAVETGERLELRWLSKSERAAQSQSGAHARSQRRMAPLAVRCRLNNHAPDVPAMPRLPPLVPGYQAHRRSSGARSSCRVQDGSLATCRASCLSPCLSLWMRRLVRRSLHRCC